MSNVVLNIYIKVYIYKRGFAGPSWYIYIYISKYIYKRGFAGPSWYPPAAPSMSVMAKGVPVCNSRLTGRQYRQGVNKKKNFF